MILLKVTLLHRTPVFQYFLGWWSKLSTHPSKLCNLQLQAHLLPVPFLYPIYTGLVQFMGYLILLPDLFIVPSPWNILPYLSFHNHKHTFLSGFSWNVASSGFLTRRPRSPVKRSTSYHLPTVHRTYLSLYLFGVHGYFLFVWLHLK